MVILLVVADLGLGGAQQVVINLANGFVHEGHKVGIIDVYPDLRVPGIVERLDPAVNLINPTFDSTRSTLVGKALNSIYYRTGLNKNYRKQKSLEEHQKSAKQWVQSNEPEVVNSHVWWADRWVYENRDWLPNKWWVTTHGSYLEMNKSEDRDDFLNYARAVGKRVTGFICISNEESSHLTNVVGVDLHKIRFVNNGIPSYQGSSIYAKKDFGFSESDVVALCASRAIREKGWFELAESFRRISETRKDIKLILAGNGPISTEIERELVDLKDCVRYIGYHNDIRALLQVADFVVLPTYFSGEAFPTILLEAIQQGVPVISTTVGEIPEIVKLEDGSSAGILVQSQKDGVDVNALTEALLQISRSESLNLYRASMRNNPFRFDLSKQINGYLVAFCDESE